MKLMSDFIDDRGYIIQKYEDKYNAVDSNFLTSNTLYQKLIVNSDNDDRILAERFLKEYQSELGTLRRYYKNDNNRKDGEDLLWTNPDTVSRDNSMGFIILAGYMGRYDIVRKFAINTIKRKSFFQNYITTKGLKKIVPDFCGPSSWSTIVRSCFSKPTLICMFPLLLILDFFFMLSLLFDIAKSYYHPKEVSTCYHVISAIVQKKQTVQTPFTFLGSLLYLELRKPIEGHSGEPLVTCIKRYSRAKYDPPIYEVTELVLNKIKVKEL